jgi:phosphate transport system substrate-binding protein
VAQRAAKTADGPAPVVEHTGTTQGFAYLCAGTGAAHPDAASVTRRIRKGEFDTCQRNGVTEIVEIPIGLDILVVAQSKAGSPLRLTLAQLFLALAKDVPGGNSGLIANPHRKWSDIDPALPDVGIDVRVLPTISGTRGALERLFLERGAERVPGLARLLAKDRALRKTVRRLRDDYPLVAVHEDQEVIVRQLLAHPNAVGVFGYRFLQANRATLKGVPLEGAEPTEENAYAGKYPGTRRLYIYVNKARLGAIRGLLRLGTEYVSSAALGPSGYLLKMGFVPLPINGMIKAMAVVQAMPPLRRDMLD